MRLQASAGHRANFDDTLVRQFNLLTEVSTPERNCIGGPEQKSITASSKKAPDIGGLLAFAFQSGDVASGVASARGRRDRRLEWANRTPMADYAMVLSTPGLVDRDRDFGQLRAHGAHGLGAGNAIVPMAIFAEAVPEVGLKRLRASAGPARLLRHRRGGHARFEGGHALLSRHPVDCGLLADTRDAA
jgi:hypothetical protein